MEKFEQNRKNLWCDYGLYSKVVSCFALLRRFYCWVTIFTENLFQGLRCTSRLIRSKERNLEFAKVSSKRPGDLLV